jgi:hypothetical protein
MLEYHAVYDQSAEDDGWYVVSILDFFRHQHARANLARGSLHGQGRLAIDGGMLSGRGQEAAKAESEGNRPDG